MGSAGGWEVLGEDGADMGQDTLSFGFVKAHHLFPARIGVRIHRLPGQVERGGMNGAGELLVRLLEVKQVLISLIQHPFLGHHRRGAFLADGARVGLPSG